MCQLCQTVISRGGGSSKFYTTSALNNHLSYKHPEEFKQVKQTASVASSPSSATPQRSGQDQPTLSEVLGKRKPWTINSAEAQKVHQAIGKMIAVDIQPYSIAEDDGFKSLMSLLEPRYVLPSRKYFTEKVIPEMYDAVMVRVQVDVDEAKFISFTADTWTAQSTTTSFMSLTAQWIDDNFTRKSAVLHCEKFDGQHTGIRLADALLAMMQKWKIDKERVHVVLRDGAANIVKGMCDADLPSISCFAHTLQLALNDGILCQSSVAELILSARKIVGHFRHSSSATSRLHEIQEELSLPKHQLKQVCNQMEFHLSHAGPSTGTEPCDNSISSGK